jgi:glycosyltransferase involved in cell wall biosynthesis
VETHLLNLCRVLVDHGAEVTFVARVARPETPLVQRARELPIRLITTPFASDLRWFRPSTAWALLVWPLVLTGRRFDVLYTVELSRFTRFLSRFVKPDGYVIANRIGEPASDARAVDPRAADLLDGFIVESVLQAQAMRKFLSAGVPLAAIPLLGHVKAAPRWKPRAVGQFRVAFLGRYDPAKGVYRLLNIWNDLPNHSAALDFYGHGAELEGMMYEIARRGLADRVRVNGGWSTGEELASILAETDLVVLPSETEGLPVVLLEAMAHGVPFVATDVGAVRSLAVENPDVRVVPLDNGAIKQAINEMEQQIRTGKVLGARLQTYYENRYSYVRLSSSWAEALLKPEQFWGGLLVKDAAVPRKPVNAVTDKTLGGEVS